MAYIKFDPAKLDRLNDPDRLAALPPVRMWEALGHPTDVRTIVEIGAGTGLFAAAFADLVPSATVYATDIEQSMLDWMSEHRAEVDQGRIRVIRSDESHVPLDDASADLVYMINLHHELADPRAMYREAYRLLGAGGHILVADWAPRQTEKGPPLHIRVQPTVVTEMLQDAGFSQAMAHDDALETHWLVTAVRA